MGLNNLNDDSTVLNSIGYTQSFSISGVHKNANSREQKETDDPIWAAIVREAKT